MYSQQGPTAQGILLNVMWQPGWEGSLGESGYMYMCGWIPLLSTWNNHIIVTQLYTLIQNKKLKEKKKDNFMWMTSLTSHILFLKVGLIINISQKRKSIT